MNTHELCTWLEKVETRAEKKLRKAETNLRFSAQPETKTSFTNGLRQFSAKNKNSLKQPLHTAIVDSSSAGVAQSGADIAGSAPPSTFNEALRLYPAISHQKPPQSRFVHQKQSTISDRILSGLPVPGLESVLKN